MKHVKSTPVRNPVSHTPNSSKRYKIICTQKFLKAAKKLLKKYPNIKADFFALRDILREDPTGCGISLGDGTYKVRMAITDKNCGDSGGARVIFQVQIIDRAVYVLYVYDKGEMENIVEKFLNKLKSKK